MAGLSGNDIRTSLAMLFVLAGGAVYFGKEKPVEVNVVNIVTPARNIPMDEPVSIPRHIASTDKGAFAVSDDSVSAPGRYGCQSMLRLSVTSPYKTIKDCKPLP